jgi:CheY-like chemotaxis protein
MTVNSLAPNSHTGTALQEDKTMPPHVLLVDHDFSNLTSGRQLLEDMGYSVTPCETSEKALVLIHTKSEKFSCVLSDVSMPRIGCLELANTSRLCRPETPFLLTSAGANSLCPDFLRTLGIHGHIAKPFSAESLGQALKRALSARTF